MSKRPSLADMRQRFKSKSDNKKKINYNSDVFPHWEIPEGKTATIRILPDANEDNELFFCVNKLEHKLSIEGKDKKIPCLKMYGEKCPICELSAKYYKAEGDGSTNGKYYYFKRFTLLKALVLKDPIDPEDGKESSQGQVKTLQLTHQLMKVIEAALGSEDEEKALEAFPWNIDEGYNFIIEKTKDGKYDSYNTSSFSNKITAVPDEYYDLVKDSIVDLRTLLPANPGVDAVQALLEQHLGTYEGDDDEHEEAEEKPVTRRSRAETADEDEAPVRRRRAVEEDEEEEAPVRRRRAVEEDEEEAPVRRRRVEEAVEEEEEAPVRRRRAVEEDEEEEAPVRRRRPSAEESDDEDSEIAARIARRRSAS